ALLALGAAAATLGVAIVWVVQNSDLAGTPWTVAAVFVAFAAAHHVAVELARPGDGEEAEPQVTALARAAALVGLGLLVLQGLAILQARLASRRAAEHAAAAIALVLLLGRLADPASGALVGLGVPLVLGFLVLLAGTRLGGGPWLLLATLATALVQFAWPMD